MDVPLGKTLFCFAWFSTYADRIILFFFDEFFFVFFFLLNIVFRLNQNLWEIGLKN